MPQIQNIEWPRLIDYNTPRNYEFNGETRWGRYEHKHDLRGSSRVVHCPKCGAVMTPTVNNQWICPKDKKVVYAPMTVDEKYGYILSDIIDYYHSRGRFPSARWVENVITEGYGLTIKRDVTPENFLNLAKAKLDLQKIDERGA